MELLEELSNKNFHFYCSKRDYFCLRVSPKAPFYWKLFKIGMRSAKEIRKDVLIFKFVGPPLPRSLRLY